MSRPRLAGPAAGGGRACQVLTPPAVAALTEVGKSMADPCCFAKATAREAKRWWRSSRATGCNRCPRR
ncbi:MAG: hypothetical protein R3B72_51285 [Polyangiaceae bacterium]